MDASFSFCFCMLLMHWFCFIAGLPMNISTDQSALLVLKARNSLDPENYLAENWSSSSSVCNWMGVTCSARHHRVAALNVSNMGLVGSIPPELGNLSFLVSLDMSGNTFQGNLPEELARLKRLQFMSFSFNELSGGLPSWFEGLPNFQDLLLDNNSFSGVIPRSLCNLSKLETLNLQNNLLGGSVPEEIGNLQNMKTLQVRNNQLSGSIPQSMFNISSMEKLDFTSNSLSGYLPKSMCDHLPKLQYFSLFYNQLEGLIPSSLDKCTQLQTLIFEYNRFTGPVPREIGNLTMLKYLYLGGNNLKGQIPEEIGKLPSLGYLTLEETGLTGSMPSFIYNISTLQWLFIDLNNLTGSLPRDMCGQLPFLQGLYLSRNQITGGIPPGLQNCTALVELFLQENKLTGEIPGGGPFANLTHQSFISNEALCGPPWLQIPPCRTSSAQRSRLKTVLIIVLPTIIVAIIVLLSAFVFVRRRQKNGTHTEVDVFSGIAPARIAHHELQRATNGFNESNLLGMGSFGSVYKGVLTNGMVVAIKVFNLHTEGAFNSFDTECEVLRNLRHRNLTKVISSCSNPDFRGLVLEYMPNGSLEKWLHSDNHSLNILQRLDIMRDVASALDYLHHGYSMPVIHCDLKPSNILLDENMVAHVSDFGIAKLVGAEDSVVQTRTLATLGYIAPEYGLEGLVSTRCDVYSYGIMMIETFTGRKPSDDHFAGDLNLRAWVNAHFPNSLIKVVDRKLLDTEEDQFTERVQCASSILELALKCSAESAGDRINIRDALASQEKIRVVFTGKHRRT